MAFTFLLAVAALVVAILARRRVEALDQQVRGMRIELAGLARKATKVPRRPAELLAAVRPVAHVEAAPPSPVPPSVPLPAPVVAPPAPPVARPEERPVARTEPVAPPPPPAVSPQPFASFGVADTGQVVREPRAVKPAPTPRELDRLELLIGGSWLNRIGVALLVIGMVFALGYTITHLGPVGKSVLATALSLLLLLSGVWLEKLEAYRSYARGLIAGGWAALYATAYAVHELDATRIVADARLGFALLLLVGAGMIVHSLRYENQGLTTLAYGLAYAAIVLHSISAYTLLAGSVLGLGTVLHLLRRQWQGVALGGIVATYGSLLLWYHGQQPLTAQTLHLGLAALAIDWVVFLCADFAPESANESEPFLAQVVSLLNAFAAAGLACLAWQGVFPLTMWQPLLVLGVAYVATSVSLRRMARVTTHQVHSTVAALFIGVAAGKALELTPASWIWLVEAQLVVLIGVWLKDRFHRILGCVLFLAPMAAIVMVQIGERSRLSDGAFQPGRLALTAAACGAFYLTFARLKPFVSSAASGEGDVEETIRRNLSYAAFALVLLALWVQLPLVYVAPASALLAVLLFELATRTSMVELRVQSYLAAAWASLAACVLTAPSATLLLSTHARVPSLVVTALALFAIYARGAKGRARLIDQDETLQSAFSYVAFVLVLLALWFRLPHPYFAPASAFLMLFLFEISRAFEMKELRVQCYLAAACAAGAALALSASSHAQVLGFAQRILTLILVAIAFFVLFGRRSERRAALFEWEGSLRPALSWAGVFLAALAVWLEARPVAVGPSWMLMALLLVEVGIGVREIHLRRPGYALLLASHISLLASNLTATDSVFGISVRAATVLPVIAGTYYLWWRLRALPAEGERKADPYDEGFGRVLSYAAAVMVGLFSRYQFGLDGAALRWSIAMVALFAAGYLLRDADFRLQAYALAAAVCVRAIGFDFQHASPVMGVDGPLAVTLVGLAAYIAAGLMVHYRSVPPPEGERRTSSLEARLSAYGRDSLWMLGVALAALYLYRTQAGFMLIVGWAVEGLLTTAGGFASRSQPLRLAGLGLLALALLLTMVRAFTTFNTLGRIISFIVLGIVLLLVSLGYTRYRQRVRRTP